MAKKENRRDKKILALLLAMTVMLSVFVPMMSVSAAGADCASKYPVVLVHGAGFKDKTLGINYWGRIPAALEAEGAKVCYGGTDGWGSTQDNAAKLRDTINQVLASTGAAKVNIIAHSKGGVEARYMISSLGMAGKVASLTMISTPNYGSALVGGLYDSLPDILFRVIGAVANVVRWFYGDKNPDFYNGVLSLTPAYMEAFNKQNPNKSGVYYQSYAGSLENPTSDIIMMFTAYPIRNLEGENDGMVSVASAKWGNFRGVLRGSGYQGISHIDEIDLRRRDIAIEPIHGATTIREFYVAVVQDLKARGL